MRHYVFSLLFVYIVIYDRWQKVIMIFDGAEVPFCIDVKQVCECVTGALGTKFMSTAARLSVKCAAL